MVSDGARQLRMTEPKVIDCVLCEGVTIEVRDELIRIVGWVDLETVRGKAIERRIVLRAGFPLLLARALIRDLRKALTRGLD